MQKRVPDFQLGPLVSMVYDADREKEVFRMQETNGDINPLVHLRSGTRGVSGGQTSRKFVFETEWSGSHFLC
tara:strand:+ start:190 stop:405 length:216 start_codon:yes stop_codon:yes gene_type:complete